MAGDDSALKVLDVTKDFGDRFADDVVWRDPESDRYPEGIKYSMPYGNVAGETIVRYDNVPNHPGAARHHKHTANGSVEDVAFGSIRDLYERFKQEVIHHGDEWD